MERFSDDIGDNEMTAERKRKERGVVRATLRFVTDSSTVDDEDVAPRQLPSIDLAVGEQDANRLYRAMVRAIVSAGHAPGTNFAVHKGLRKVLSQQLEGRDPYVIFDSDRVRVNFAVWDASEASWAQARSVGDYLVAAIDPGSDQEPRVNVVYIDTSDIDPYLPEDQRTLR